MTYEERIIHLATKDGGQHAIEEWVEATKYLNELFIPLIDESGDIVLSLADRIEVLHMKHEKLRSYFEKKLREMK